MNAMENWKSPCVVDIPCPIVVWLRNTFELDPEARVTKNEVYGMYEAFCRANGYTAKRNSDFGKIMKKAFPEVVSRRLGSAGLQKAHYSGISIKPEFLGQATKYNNNRSPSTSSTPPRSPTSPRSSLSHTVSPKLRRKTPGSSRKKNQEANTPSSPPSADCEAYHSPPRPVSSRKRKVRETEGNNNKGSKAARALNFDSNKKNKPNPPAVAEEEAQPLSLPASLLAAPNIVIHNTFTVNHPSINPHSSTDAFFSASSSTSSSLLGSSGPTPITNLDIRLSTSQHFSPMEQNEDHQLGNDQSPHLRLKPAKRATRELAPLSPHMLCQISPLAEKRAKSEAYTPPSEGLEEETTEFSELQPFPVSNVPSYCAQSFETSTTTTYPSPEQLLCFMQQTEVTPEQVEEAVHDNVTTFQTKMWPLVPIPAAVFNPLSMQWYLHEGRTRSTKLTLYINLSLYYAAVSNDELTQARQLFDVLLDMIPNFFAEHDLSVALVLVMLSSSTFSWLEADQAFTLSREFLQAAIHMCERMDQQDHSEVYHMCLDMRSWIESGRLTPSLHARFPLHNNEYPLFLLPCRVAIKQCFHLIAMVRHIVFILERSASTVSLPDCALEDVKEKLSLLKACYTNMSSPAMAGHPFLAGYIKLLLVGSMAELRAVMGHTEKAKVKAMLFTEMVGLHFPFPEVVFYAHRVFDILMANGIREHAKLLVKRLSDKYSGLNDVAEFVRTCRLRLVDHQHMEFNLQM